MTYQHLRILNEGPVSRIPIDNLHKLHNHLHKTTRSSRFYVWSGVLLDSDGLLTLPNVEREQCRRSHRDIAADLAMGIVESKNQLEFVRRGELGQEGG